MKARHLFATLFLPSVFMACTADDWTTEQQGNPALQGRKVVGDITFVAPDADTRVVFDPETKELKWTSADRLGAALMDETDDGSNYNLVDKVYTNYLYTYDNGVFTNGNATFVEGNYFIYAQYRDQARTGGLAYSINPDQETGTTDKLQSWYDNQMFLDHVFIKQGADNQVEINPLGVFPRVRFDLKYEGSNYNDLVINKIVVKASDQFNVVGALTPGSTHTANYNPLDLYEITAINNSGVRKSNYGNASATIAEAFDLYKQAKADLGVKYTVNGVEAKGVKFVSPILASYFDTTKDGKDVTAMTLNFSEPASFAQGIMVLPLSETHTNTNLTFEIYTNKGMVTIAGAASEMSNAFDMADVKNYPTSLPTEDEDDAEELSTGTPSLADKAQLAIKFTGLNTAFVTGLASDVQQNTVINFKDDAILVPNAITVSSTDELLYYLQNWYAGKKNNVVGGDKNTVTITAAPKEGATIEINSAVFEFIKNNATNPDVQFVGDIVIPADADPTTINYIKKGSTNLNVINKATQNWTATAEFTTLTNEGTLTIGTGAADETATYTVTTINNNKSLTVNKAIGAGFTDNVYNLGTLVANANIDANVINGTGGVDGNHTAKMTLNTGSVTILTNYAEFEVPAGKNVTVQKIENYYNAVISGTLRTATVSKSLNAAGATITLNEGAKWNVADSQSGFENNGTVTNKGTITVDEKFTNKGTVNNYKQIACSDGASFNNEKLMNVYANSITLISKNDDPDAEIIVEQGVTTINVAGEDKGKITFVVSSQEGLNSIPTIANSLRITAPEIDLSDLNNAKITFVEFKPEGNMSITCKSGDDVNSFNVVTFTADTEKQFNLSGNLTAAEKLTIGTNATVVINDKLTFAGTEGGKFTNNGSMLIIGTLDFSGITEDNKGTVTLGNYLFAGGSASTNITWKTAGGSEG